jgi:hypothetical protein
MGNLRVSIRVVFDPGTSAVYYAPRRGPGADGSSRNCYLLHD